MNHVPTSFTGIMVALLALALLNAILTSSQAGTTAVNLSKIVGGSFASAEGK